MCVRGGGGHSGPDSHKVCNGLESTTNDIKIKNTQQNCYLIQSCQLKYFFSLDFLLFFITKSRLIYLVFVQLILGNCSVSQNLGIIKNVH
jgi:hypothetical protein